ncbi:hypothetical protein [Sphingomonas sp. LT1P40]|uniref:hypothetical protein n=1 Tax=Alteristakelama amylovorans TaxID=3096166 RepID=UPI002FCAA4BB
MLYVLLFMIRNAPSSNADSANTGYRVSTPRTCDAVGVVLRDAYERDLGIPDDMASLLRQLNVRSLQDN